MQDTLLRESTRLELIEPESPLSREISAQQYGSPTVPDNSPAGMTLALLSKGATLAEVEKMMDLQERWAKTESEKVFSIDFAAFRGENVIIPKTREVDRGKAGSFMQAEYDEVCRRLSPALSRHGFGFRHDQKFGTRRVMRDGVENDEPWVWVTCYLKHRAGHTERLDLEGPPGELSANTPVQNMQVTASYLKRQSLLAITGTATGGEDDEAKLRGRIEIDGVAAAQLEGFRAAATKGISDLRKHYEANVPTEEFWQQHSKSLRAAAKKADEDRQS